MIDIKYWVVDVDGTLTDGSIYYDEHGNELKKFCTKDAAAFTIAHRSGMKILILTGRKCQATERRMKELNVDYLYQGIKNKYQFLVDFFAEKKISKYEIGYIGDDLNDIEAMKLAGFIGCPSDACIEVKRLSNYISSISGGYGAVRDIIEYTLREKGVWEQSIRSLYGGL